MRMIWPSVDIDNDRMGVEAQPTRLRVSTTGSVFINEERPQGQAEIIRSRELLPCEEVAMVREAEVTCVSKTDHTEPYDRIRSLGGGTGPYWEISHARAIDLVEHDRLRFYTCTPQGERLYLVVVTSRDGYKYIKTVADEVVRLGTPRRCPTPRHRRYRKQPARLPPRIQDSGLGRSAPWAAT